MSDAPSLSLALRWILQERGLTEAELALSAGVSPGAVAACLGKPSAPTHTWLSLIAGLGCRLEVKTARAVLVIALPRSSAARRANERRQWEHRHLVAYRAQVLRQSPGTSPAAAAETAANYLAASVSRLDDELAAARARLQSSPLTTTAPSLRAALRLLAGAADVRAEQFALLSGMSLGAAQAALDQTPDGKLLTPHRLFSALNARLVLLPAAGGTITIDLVAPGPWRPEAPRPGVNCLTQDEIRTRAAGGESLASIARDAGVSRQRVHAIVRSPP